MSASTNTLITPSGLPVSSFNKVVDLSSKSIKPINPITLESLIEDLDQRGLLVLQILLGQQAMKLLTEDKK